MVRVVTHSKVMKAFCRRMGKAIWKMCKPCTHQNSWSMLVKGGSLVRVFPGVDKPKPSGGDGAGEPLCGLSGE